MLLKSDGRKHFEISYRLNEFWVYYIKIIQKFA